MNSVVPQAMIPFQIQLKNLSTEVEQCAAKALDAVDQSLDQIDSDVEELLGGRRDPEELEDVIDDLLEEVEHLLGQISKGRQ